MKYQKIVIIFFSVFLSLCSQQLFAASLQQAKAAGWVGEQNNGYLGFVTPGANDAVKKLVSDVNAKRRTLYARLATKQKITLGQVEIVAAERNAKKTVSGNYYQNADGNWVKKK